MINNQQNKKVGRLKLTCTVQLPSIVSSRANRSCPKFATVDKWGRGILQKVRSVPDRTI